MQTNNHKIVDYDAVLDARFGAEGTPERARAEEDAYPFYLWVLLFVSLYIYYIKTCF